MHGMASVSLPTVVLVVLLISSTVLLQLSSAAYVLEVRPYRYTNRRHRASNGGCCDFGIPPKWCFDECENIFVFCLRGSNVRDANARNCPLGRDRFRIDSDDIYFPQDDSSVHSLSSRTSWPGSAQLYVRIVDYDKFSKNDHVDNIYIPIRLNPGESTSLNTFVGYYKRSSLQLSVRLSCQPNFYGRDCLTYCIPTDRNGIGHFGCGPAGERLCLKGWKDPGNHCLTPVCEECSPIGGRCTAPNECTCQPDWSGTDCDQCSRTSIGCSTEGGYCIRPGECRCHEGYAGDNCEVYLLPCKHEPCQNGATCVNNDRGSYTCLCNSGYSGHNCTIQCDSAAGVNCTDECNNTTNPCENGGICQTQSLRQAGVNTFGCTCSRGFTGKYCETSVDICFPNPCRNRGLCQNVSSTYVCTCAEGFTGPHCDGDIDYCLSQPCQNNGTCTDLTGSNYTCTCPSGWEGTDCSVERDECEHFDPCKNGANCTDKFDDYECDCVLGYVGYDCEQEIDECSPNPCQNGNCTDLLNNYTCHCLDEFTGANCETDLNSCRSAPCLHGGSCENEPDGFYFCTCPPGYTGFSCEVVDYCLSSPCNNQGTCIDEIDDYYCVCTPGFTGKDCSIALNVAVPIQQEQGVGAIAGGITGLIIILLVLIALIIVAVYLLQRKKSNKYNAMSTVAYSVNGDGYHNPTYAVDVHIQDPGRNRQKSQGQLSDHTYSMLRDDQATPLITGVREEDQFEIEYHNFDNPLYAEGGAAGEVTVAASPTYSRTSLPGPRGPTTTNSKTSAVGNGRSSSHVSSAVPGPMEYTYVGVTQQQASGSHELQQKDDVYESINSGD